MVMIALTALGVGTRPAGSSSPIVVIMMLVLLAVGFSLSLWQFKRRGPAISGWIPRRLRARANAWYRGRGWDEPYDQSGNKRQR
jgi:hypothetical protein